MIDFSSIASRDACWVVEDPTTPRLNCVLHDRRELVKYVRELQGLLGLIYGKWENGDPCFEEPDTFGGPLGNAFKLSDEEERAILAALSSASAKGQEGV